MNTAEVFIAIAGGVALFAYIEKRIPENCSMSRRITIRLIALIAGCGFSAGILALVFQI